MIEDDAISPTLLQKKIELEKVKTQDLLNRRIGNRPDKLDLKQRNILKSKIFVLFNIYIFFFNLAGSSDSLDISGLNLNQNVSFEKKATKLKSILKNRPEKSQLEELNIMSHSSANLDPSLISAQKSLKKRQLENTLDAKLRKRPQIDQMEKFLNFAEIVEVLPTFRKSEYCRKTDKNATFKKLTPQMKDAIRDELNSFKKSEMPVHEDSSMNTCFH